MGNLEERKITLDLVLDIKDEKYTTKLVILNVLSLVVVAVINLMTLYLMLKDH